MLQQVQGLLLGPAGVGGLDQLPELLVGKLCPRLQPGLEEHLRVHLHRRLSVYKELGQPLAPGLPPR